jgi:hypothetical protein
MENFTGRMRAAAIAGAAIALLVTGCATGPGGAIDGNPEEAVPAPAPVETAPAQDDFGPSVAWLEEGASFELTTYGSSSCPAEVAEVLLDAADLVTLQLAPPSEGACTMDMAPTTQTIELPEGADGRPLGVALRASDGTVTAELSLD